MIERSRITPSSFPFPSRDIDPGWSIIVVVVIVVAAICNPSIVTQVDRVFVPLSEHNDSPSVGCLPLTIIRETEPWRAGFLAQYLLRIFIGEKDLVVSSRENGIERRAPFWLFGYSLEKSAFCLAWNDV